MNPGYPKICKNFKFGNIPQNNALETSNYSKFVEEVFLLSLKAFFIFPFKKKYAEVNIFAIYTILTAKLKCTKTIFKKNPSCYLRLSAVNKEQILAILCFKQGFHSTKS